MTATQHESLQEIPGSDPMHGIAETGGQPDSVTILSAIESLQQKPSSERMWSSTPIIRNGAEVDIVDADTSENPEYRVFLRLSPERWTKLYEDLGERPDVVDEDYGWAQKSTGEPAWLQNKSPSARTVLDVQTGATLSLLSSSQALAYDGLVEITVPKSGDTGREAAQIDTALEFVMGGQPTEEYGAAWLRAYDKLPFGPLTAQQSEELAKLVEARQVSPHHIAPVMPGMHRAYVHERTGEQLTARHEIAYLSDAIDIIANGGITPTLERLKRGEGNVTGRSSYSDINFGGADSVFAYFMGSNTEQRGGGSYFRFKPDILDRLDVRAYEDDAYGSRERDYGNDIDHALGRVVLGSKLGVNPGYDDRAEPKDFGSVGGVHEVCFEKEVGINECEYLVLQDTDQSSYDDIRWDSVLPAIEYKDWHLQAYGQSLKLEIKARIKEAWGDEAAVRTVLNEWVPAMRPEAVDYAVVGMKLPLKERMLARLAHRGISEINGRPAEEFIKVLR